MSKADKESDKSHGGRAMRLDGKRCDARSVFLSASALSDAR